MNAGGIKGKPDQAIAGDRQGAHLLDRPLSPLKSAMLGQCDARLMVTFPAVGRHRHLTGTNLCCLITEVHVCEQLA